MPSDGLLAVDLALLLPEAVKERAKDANRGLLAARPDGFALDRTHLPHVTLAQLFVRRARRTALAGQVEPVLRAAPPLALRVTGVGSSGTAAHFVIEGSPPLRRLHEALMEAVAPFEEEDGSVESFYSAREPARENDVRWVRQYRSHASSARFAPHVTLGVGPPPEFHDPLEFLADRAALCHLGRFCTCRVVLREWILTIML